VQVPPHPGQVGDDVDAQRGELVRRADAAAQQDRRRSQGARAEHHLVGAQLAQVTADLGEHSDDPAAPEHQPVHQRSRVDGHRPQHRPRVGVPGGEPASAPERDPLDRHAIEPLTVVVRVVRQAVLHRGVHNGPLDRVQRLVRDDLQEILLDPLEHRLDVCPRPAGQRPAVVVRRRAADPDHRVERVRAAEHLAPRQVQPPVRRVRLRHRVVVPVLRSVPQLPRARRVVDGGVRVLATRFQQRHRRARVHQPPGHHRAGRAGTHHDHVHGSSLARPGGARCIPSPAVNRHA